LTALWPAYGEAFGRRDFPWIRNIYYRSLRYSFFLNIPLTILLIIFANQIVSYWLNVHVEYSNLLIAGMGGWSLLTVLGGNFSTLLNGLQVVKFQVITSVIMALVNIVLSIYLVKKLGISGPILASLISLVAFSYIPSYFYIKKIIFRKEF
jgi:O-antigen/teichoic acid export membrane protein